MKDLHEVLRAKEGQLARLEKEVAALREAMKILADEEGVKTPKKTARKPRGASLITAVMTQPQMIRAVLLESGEPLHVDQISKAIEKKYNLKYESLYLTSIIYRKLKKEKLFRKDGPNTFGLLEWPTPTKHVNPGDSLRVQ